MYGAATGRISGQTSPEHISQFLPASSPVRQEARKPGSQEAWETCGKPIGMNYIEQLYVTEVDRGC